MSSLSVNTGANPFDSYSSKLLKGPIVKSTAEQPVEVEMQTYSESMRETQTKTEQLSNKTLAISSAPTGSKIDEAEEKVVHSTQSTETVDDDIDRPLGTIINCSFPNNLSYCSKFREFIKLVQSVQTKYPGMLDVTIDETNLSVSFYHGVDEMNALSIFIKGIPFSELPPEENANLISMTGGLTTVSEETRSKFQERKVELLKKAEAFLDQSVDKKKIHEHKTLDEKSSIKKIIKELFKTAQGVCVGERHGQTSAKEWIISHLSDLDVKTVYIEHLHYDTLQRLLDEYSASSEKEPSLLLDRYLKYLDDMWMLKNKPGSYRNLVIAAKKAGARVVGLDTTIVSRCGMDRKTGIEDCHEREKAFSYAASKIIKREQQRVPGRYIALMGNFHTCSSNGDGVLGISELMNASCMTIRNNKEGKPVISYYAANVQPEAKPRKWFWL